MQQIKGKYVYLPLKKKNIPILYLHLHFLYLHFCFNEVFQCSIYRGLSFKTVHVYQFLFTYTRLGLLVTFVATYNQMIFANLFGYTLTIFFIVVTLVLFLFNNFFVKSVNCLSSVLLLKEFLFAVIMYN